MTLRGRIRTFMWRWHPTTIAAKKSHQGAAKYLNGKNHTLESMVASMYPDDHEWIFSVWRRPTREQFREVEGCSLIAALNEYLDRECRRCLYLRLAEPK